MTEEDRAAPPPGGALHEDLHRDEAIEGPTERRFGLTIGAILGIIGAIRLVLGHEHWAWWLGAGIAFAGFALVWPAVLWPLNRLWLLLGIVLYKVVNPVVMALLFFSTIVPIGALMRLFGKDPLRLRREPEAASYWIEREPPGPPPETMRNQF
jgi:saxitoxin biosynthesis operon SxtJ-like protein